MRKIFKKVLKDSFGDNTSLINAISFLNTDEQERFIELCVGCEITEDELPKKIRRNNVIYTLESCNYIKNEIIAKYVGTDTRYFSTQEEANEFAITGKYNYNTSTYKETETCNIKGEYTSKRETWFTYDDWMNSEVVED